MLPTPISFVSRRGEEVQVLPLIDYSIEKDLRKIMELEYHLPVTPAVNTRLRQV